MLIEQISVFLENKKGRLADLTHTLAQANIDLIALSIADTTNFGILRAIVSDTDSAAQILKEAGFTVNLTQVLAVRVDDAPGGLDKILSIMTKNDISVEYLYSFVCNRDSGALILVRTESPEKAGKILQDQGICLVNQEELLKIRS